MANPYWVGSSGVATWVNAQSATPLTGTACCSVSTMNSNIAAGDTVYLRAGTYSYTTLYGIHVDLADLAGSGSAWTVVSAYNSESVNLVGEYGTTVYGLWISNSSYLKVIGLTFSDHSGGHNIWEDSNHIEIDSCTFQNITSPYRDGTVYIIEVERGWGSYDHEVSHIWIHDCTFYKLAAGGSSCEDQGGDGLRIGFDSLQNAGGTYATGLNANITIENCYLAYSGHAVFDNYGQKCVVKNNRSHNEPWYPEYNASCRATNPNPSDEYTNGAYTGLYGHRNWQITDTFNSSRRYNLYEKNRLGHAGVNPSNDGSTNLVLAAPGNIARFNYLYNAMHNNMKTKYGDEGQWQDNGGCYNHVYNNTLYKSGYGYQPFMDSYPTTRSMRGFRYYLPSYNPGNAFKNNIVYNSYAGDQADDDIDDCTSTPDSVESNNWGTNTGHGCVGSGDPLFVDDDLTNTTSATLPDLRLQSGSPCIEEGTYLTQASGSGSSSTTLVVDDALYFQDGTWGADMTHGVTLFPDQIAIGTVGNTVAISSINYATNTITLASAMTWSDNAYIWLYKDSDGSQVLYGTAPNIGVDQGTGASGAASTFRQSIRMRF